MLHRDAPFGSPLKSNQIRGIPDHVTFREKVAKLACADKLGVFLSLTLCNKANFDPLQRIKYDGLEKNVKQDFFLCIVFFFLT